MACAGARIGFLVSVVLFPHCVVTEFAREVIFKPEISSTSQQNVTVSLGSTVTFSCLNRWNVRTNWYKTPSSGQVAAFVDKDEKKPTNDNRAEGSPGRQHNDFGAFEEDIGGQYAAISDTKNLTPKVVAENPMYEAYGQEDGGDHVPDVYSVVQKPLKSQSSTNDDGKDPNQPVTDDNVADVYSVVQKPSKLQESGSVPDGTKDTQPSGSEEMGDVYSVVQKPAKG